MEKENLILSEHGLWKSNLRGECSSKCEPGATECCNQRILQYQPDFQEQRPFIQEITRLQGTRAFSCRSSTVNSISLSFSGEESKNTPVIIRDVEDKHAESTRICPGENRSAVGASYAHVDRGLQIRLTNKGGSITGPTVQLHKV